MEIIRKVVVVGAGGNLGPEIVKALVAQQFDVSILVRESSQLGVASDITVLRTDYTPSSLVRVLTGQQAVISAIGAAGLGEQIKIIEAAEQAGVKRFIPSEFGNNAEKASIPEFEALLSAKGDVLDFLKERARLNSDFTWSAIANGPFFDWGLKTHGALGFDLEARAAVIYDSGNEPFSATNIDAVAHATVRLLQMPTATANKYLCIASLVTTQNSILAALEEETGDKWSVTHISTKNVMARGKQKLLKGDYSCFLDFLIVHMFQDGGGRIVVGEGEPSANKLLDVPLVNLKDDVRKILKN